MLSRKQINTFTVTLCRVQKSDVTGQFEGAATEVPQCEQSLSQKAAQPDQSVREKKKQQDKLKDTSKLKIMKCLLSNN